MNDTPDLISFRKEDIIEFRKIYDVFPDSFKQHLSKERFAELHVSGRINDTEQNYPEMMIEFAKLHVAKALSEASDFAIACGDEELVDNILEIYPLKNIK